MYGTFGMVTLPRTHHRYSAPCRMLSSGMVARHALHRFLLHYVMPTNDAVFVAHATPSFLSMVSVLILLSHVLLIFVLGLITCGHSYRITSPGPDSPISIRTDRTVYRQCLGDCFGRRAARRVRRFSPTPPVIPSSNSYALLAARHGASVTPPPLPSALRRVLLLLILIITLLHYLKALCQIFHACRGLFDICVLLLYLSYR